MRLFIALRSRFADDCIRNALLRGVRQVGILGAGLDTTAFRLSWDQTVTVFEIDHPETQAWKRHLLREADLAIPGAVRFLAVDFEACDWGAALLSSGFDASAPSIFIWLGVTPYLTHAAIQASLRFVGALRGGAEIVFDYGEPLDALSGLARAARESRMAQTAALGEPWISLFNPASMGELLRKEGFRHVEDRGGWDIALIYAPGVQRGEGGGGHIVRACTFEDMT
jgi:methyltransferase (TIGR00027 family)